MRLIPCFALAALCACSSEAPLNLPPLDRFYFPTAVAHVASSDGGLGTLFVASSDFDKRFDVGAVTAVNLDDLDWQSAELKNPSYLAGPLDAGTLPPPQPPVPITDLKISESQRVFISPFAGLMDVWTGPDHRPRLFVPTRAERDLLFAIDADGANLSCPAPAAEDRNCIPDATSLTAQGAAAGDTPQDGFEKGKPRAPEPYAAAVRQRDGALFVTHLQQADSPFASRNNLESFLVQISAADPTTRADSFLPIGISPATAVAPGARYAYLTGRGISSLSPPPLIRLVEPGRAPITPNLVSSFHVLEGRGIFVTRDETRAFVLGRAPDTLVVLSIQGATTDNPTVDIVRTVLLPADPNDIKAIDRGPGRGALLAITCTGANSVALYNDETGLTTLVSNVGRQPFAIAVDRRENAAGARLYVSNFDDGRVAVVDIPDVERPETAVVVAQLGESQLCLTDPGNTPGCGSGQ